MNEKKQRLEEWLESRVFYELMQAYRHAPHTPQEVVLREFNAVKRRIVRKVEEIYSGEEHNSRTQG